MASTPYFYRIGHGPQTRLRLLMNGVPFYRSVPEEVGTQHGGAANHLLVPGQNVLTLEVLQTDTAFGILLEITIAQDHKAPVVRVEWPKIWKDLPEAARVVPFRHDTIFEATGVDFVPAYLKAPKADFGRAGTPEQREAVRRYHDTTTRGDTDGFMGEVDFQLAEMARAYDNEPSLAPGALRPDMEQRFRAGVTTRPLDFDELDFESFADGRVAYVTRKDGGPALEAESKNGHVMLADLWLTQDSGRWRVFR